MSMPRIAGCSYCSCAFSGKAGYLNYWILALNRCKSICFSGLELVREYAKSTHAILANNPHLKTNRLPNVWCETVLKTDDAVLMGGSMPGLPGILSGRTADVAWGLTYSFIDAVDSWMEHYKEGQLQADQRRSRSGADRFPDPPKIAQNLS